MFRIWTYWNSVSDVLVYNTMHTLVTHMTMFLKVSILIAI